MGSAVSRLALDERRVLTGASSGVSAAVLDRPCGVKPYLDGRVGLLRGGGVHTKYSAGASSLAQIAEPHRRRLGLLDDFDPWFFVNHRRVHVGNSGQIQLRLGHVLTNTTGGFCSRVQTKMLH